MNEDKFVYKEGQLDVDIPQCATCVHRLNGVCTLQLNIEPAYDDKCVEYKKED